MSDEVWFEQIYQQYADFLFRIGRRLLTNQDEDALCDLIQEAFLLLWDRRATLRSHPNIGGWLVEAVKLRIRGSSSKITRRSLRHAYSLDSEDALPLEDAAALSPEQSLILESRIEQLRALLGEDNANLFLDFTLRGYPARDLSARYGISESCVFMRLSRIRKKLAQHPEIFYVFLTILTGFGPHNT